MHGSHLYLSNLASNNTFFLKHYSTHLSSGFLEIVNTWVTFWKMNKKLISWRNWRKEHLWEARTTHAKETCSSMYGQMHPFPYWTVLKKINKIKRVGTHVPVPGTLRELNEIGFKPKAKSMSSKDYTRALWAILTFCEGTAWSRFC